MMISAAAMLMPIPVLLNSPASGQAMLDAPP
jgi:hypothetical protein